MASNKPPGGTFSPSATPKYVPIAASSTQRKKTHPNHHIRYLNDFSKALASEVRILLQEVGKLRDERRALQQYVRPAPHRPQRL
jgi:hypothetical protein